jgi:hypothetical protein
MYCYWYHSDNTFTVQMGRSTKIKYCLSLKQLACCISFKVGFLLGVDWMLDPILTSLNVLGDAIGAGIINELSKEDLKAMVKQFSRIVCLVYLFSNIVSKASLGMFPAAQEERAKSM